MHKGFNMNVTKELCGLNTCQAVVACNCCNPTYRRIDEVVYHAKEYIVSLSTDHNKFLKKLGRINKIALVQKISYYIWALEYEMELVYRNVKSCIKDSLVCSLIEKLQALLPIKCYPKKRRDDIKNDSLFEEWVAMNTGCFPFETYSKYLYGICQTFNIKVERQSIVEGTPICNFSIGILRKEIPCDLVYALKASPVNCKVDYALTVQNKVCDLKFDMKMLEQCEFQHSILVKEYGCNLTAATYVQLIKCGLSHDFIKQAYSCGFEVCLKDHKTKCDVDYQEYVNPVCCDVSFNEQLQQNDVCITNNSVTYNVSTINFH